jgi:hypothetical protein
MNPAIIRVQSRYTARLIGGPGRVVGRSIQYLRLDATLDQRYACLPLATMRQAVESLCWLLSRLLLDAGERSFDPAKGLNQRPGDQSSRNVLLHRWLQRDAVDEAER